MGDMFFYDADEIIGVSDAIVADAETWDAGDEEERFIRGDLIRQLSGYDHAIVRCWYNPMGAWHIEELVAKK